MKIVTWPFLLIIGGFGLMATCLAMISFATLTDGVHMWATIGENLGVGIGSIGIGGLISARRR